MEFIEFLDPVEIEIIRMIEEAGYNTEENSSLCSLNKNYAGFLKKNEKIIVICTENAKIKEGYTILGMKNDDKIDRIAINIKKALRHEAVHVAQECNDGNVLDIKEKLTFKATKLEALEASKKISGEEEKERQAYILEDKPKLVIKELGKYCL